MPQSSQDLENQIEKFSFSRLPKRERIAQILVQALSGQVSFGATQADQNIPYNLKVSGDVDFLAVADIIEKYSYGDFKELFDWAVFQRDDVGKEE